MDKIAGIRQAIENAEKCKSKITDEVIAVGGFTGIKIRHLLNNLGAMATNFLEVGSLRGATYSATVFGNSNIKNAYSVDNLSEFNDGTVKDELLGNIERFTDPSTKAKFIEQDCFTLTKKDIPEPIDLYIFDGAHDRDSQAKAFTHFKGILADEFIAVVDDFNWVDVQAGTSEGLILGFEVLYFKHLGDRSDSDGSGYWNGIMVALIKKTGK